MKTIKMIATMAAVMATIVAGHAGDLVTDGHNVYQIRNGKAIRMTRGEIDDYIAKVPKGQTIVIERVHAAKRNEGRPHYIYYNQSVVLTYEDNNGGRFTGYTATCTDTTQRHICPKSSWTTGFGYSHEILQTSDLLPALGLIINLQLLGMKTLHDYYEKSSLWIGRDYRSASNPLNGALVIGHSTYDTPENDLPGIIAWINGKHDRTFTVFC